MVVFEESAINDVVVVVLEVIMVVVELMASNQAFYPPNILYTQV